MSFKDNPKTLYAAEQHSPYVQAGDLGISKSFKYKISHLIAACKNSDHMKKAPSGNPKPLEKEVMCRWVSQASKQVEPVVIKNSVRAAGFSVCHEWMIWEHDVDAILETRKDRREGVGKCRYGAHTAVEA